MKVIASDLSMPHAPRIYEGKLYVLLSAVGELAQIDLSTRKFNTITKLNGFVRGIANLFIGLSKLRKNSSTFKDLPIADKATQSGIDIVHIKTGARVGGIRWESSVDEIYDIQLVLLRL